MDWRHLDDETYRQHVAEMVEGIEKEVWERHRRRDGTTPAGAH